MIKSFKIPTPGESISEVEIANWLVKDGSYVNKNDELAEVESDKATLMLVAEESGIISIKVAAGVSVAVGSEAYTIDTDAAAPESQTNHVVEEKNVAPTEAPKSTTVPTEVKPAVNEQVKVTPVAAEMMKENNLSIDEIINGLKRIGKHEVEQVLQAAQNLQAPQKVTVPAPSSSSREQERQK